jgi:hypothetical protein
MTGFTRTHERPLGEPLQVLSILMLLSMITGLTILNLSPSRLHLSMQHSALELAMQDTASSMLAADASVPNRAVPAPTRIPFAPNRMLQCTSGRHVLGFRSQKMFVAGADHALKVEFLGARSVFPKARKKSATSQHQARVSNPLEVVTYSNLWDGITLVYESCEGGVVKSTYHIAPGTAQAGRVTSPVERIRLRYNVPVRLDDKGNLTMSFETGQMVESAPVAWQEMGGRRVPVSVSYLLLGQHEVGFSVGDYDPRFTLLLDPTLIWNTFMGSVTGDDCFGIAADGNGNVYVTGRSDADWGSPVNGHAGGAEDAFAVKLNSSGQRLWHTFMGSVSDDQGYGIAVDGSGNVYVTGISGGDWGGSPVAPYTGSNDVFAVKLNSSGQRQWHTFMGSALEDDRGNGIAVDGSGNVYVSGTSGGDWGGSPVVAYTGSNDVFAAKLNSSGVRQWHTFMGSASDDEGYGIAVDGSGNVYVSGRSDADWGGVAVNSHAGGNDAFATKLNSSGQRQWYTFMGSGSADISFGIAVDGSGNVYVSGYSDDTWGSPVNGYAGGVQDVFAAKLDSSGQRQWHTFMGSGSDDQCFGIAVDKAGKVHVAGRSNATWGNPVNGYAGGYDAFAAKLNSSGVLLWNTFMGSAEYDRGSGIAVDVSGNVYVAGHSNDTWGNPVNGKAGAVSEIDVFAAKLAGPTAKAKMFYFGQAHNLKD